MLYIHENVTLISYLFFVSLEVVNDKGSHNSY